MIADMPITERMKLVVDAVRTAQLTYLKGVNNKITTVRYDFGHPLNIINRLIQNNNLPRFQFEKYPLIALMMDFAEESPRRPSDYKKVRVRMIIANQGEQNQTEAERYESNFKPILLPLYDELMLQIGQSPYFINAGVPSHQKTDRPFYGKEGLYGNTAHTGTDILDCVEVTNLELTLAPARCRRATSFF